MLEDGMKKDFLKDFYINTALDFNNLLLLSVGKVVTEHLICGELIARNVKKNKTLYCVF